MLGGSDVLFLSQHEGEKSVLPSHSGIFFSISSQLKQALDWQIQSQMPQWCGSSHFLNNVRNVHLHGASLKLNKGLPWAIHRRSSDTEVVWTSSTWWVTSPGEDASLHFSHWAFSFAFSLPELHSADDYCCTVMTRILWHGQTCKLLICCAVATGASVAQTQERQNGAEGWKPIIMKPLNV